jgi:glycolate oxidase FAD binding subunit
MTPQGSRSTIIDAGGPPASSDLSATTHVPRDVAQLCEVVRTARASSTPLRISGGGSWLDAGRPVHAPATVDLSTMRGITEYNPGDLTLTARAGTTLAEIEAATRPHGQWLPLDPVGDQRGTLGATLATASGGALAASIGAPRDLALGLELVTGDGAIIRAGGRVVKNVAGFDLVRLNVGAWGTLGVITEATVRLRARPAGDLTIAVDVPHETGALAELLRALRLAPLAAIAMELVSPLLAATLQLGGHDLALIRLTGNEEAVDAQRATLLALGRAREVAGDAWSALRATDPPGATTIRVSRAPSAMAHVWGAANEAAKHIPGAFVHASVERGIARVVAPPSSSTEAIVTLARLVSSLSNIGAMIVERAPAPLWTEIPDGASDHLSAGVRRAFDPAGILNPGIFGASS